MRAEDRLDRLDPHDPFDALVVSLSDDTPIDWDVPGDRLAGARQPNVIALRDVARIAKFNRDLQRSPHPLGAPDGAMSAVGGDAPGAAYERWGELALLEPLGTGASGEVWRAWDARLRREVALKFLHADAAPPSNAQRESRASAAGEERLLSEARALARVRHPAVVTVYGIAEHDGRTGLWMECLNGPTLAEEIDRRGALPPADVTRIALELSRALEAVDAAGLVHRDLKPSNVVLAPGGRVVLTDFGLGQRRAFEAGGAQRISGTPVFMAPEVLDGAKATARSDCYALGVTLRWALTGRPPFRASTLDELVAEAKRGPATPLVVDRPDCPKALADIIERAMAPELKARFASAQEMTAALEAVVSGMSSRARAPQRQRWTLAIAAAVVVLAIGAWLASRTGRPDADRDAANSQLSGRSEPGPERHASNAPVNAASVSETRSREGVATSPYEVEATLVDRTEGDFRRLASGDRVSPGDQLSLEMRASRPVWVYVLNQDDRGATYLLFPQPLYDRTNPIGADSTTILPGTIGGRENGWSVTSRGGREHFLVVASIAPVAEIESELGRLPAASPDRAIEYAAIPPAAVQRLRGVGGVTPLPESAAQGSAGPFERFRALAGGETVQDSIWVRSITLENPLR